MDSREFLLTCQNGIVLVLKKYHHGRLGKRGEN